MTSVVTVTGLPVSAFLRFAYATGRLRRELATSGEARTRSNLFHSRTGAVQTHFQSVTVAARDAIVENIDLVPMLLEMAEKDLGTLKHEFDNLEKRRDETEDLWGHRGVRDAMGEFAGNMDRKRFDRVDHQVIAHGRHETLEAVETGPVPGPGQKPFRRRVMHLDLVGNDAAQGLSVARFQRGVVAVQRFAHGVAHCFNLWGSTP